MRHGAIRTVRHGRVKIGGRYYQPGNEHLPYDGRLEGYRLLFGRYRTAGQWEPLVSLWGTEDNLRLGTDDGPHCVDGSYPWLFWREVPA